jgi:hypothetical protein
MRSRLGYAPARALPAGDNDNACFSALEKETPGTLGRASAVVIVCVADHAVVAMGIA